MKENEIYLGLTPKELRFILSYSSIGKIKFLKEFNSDGFDTITAVLLATNICKTSQKILQVKYISTLENILGTERLVMLRKYYKETDVYAENNWRVEY